MSDYDALTEAIQTEVICCEPYCPWFTEHKSSPTSPCCEGAYCLEAWENYQKSQNV